MNQNLQIQSEYELDTLFTALQNEYEVTQQRISSGKGTFGDKSEVVRLTHLMTRVQTLKGQS